VPVILLALPSRRLIRKIPAGIATGLLWLARVIAGIRYQIHYPRGEENGVPVLPNGNRRNDGRAIIAAKHMSVFEVAVMALHIPNSFFIIKRELMWIPVYGWAFWRAGYLPVNRARGATNMQTLTDAVAKKVLEKQVLIIYPEGTRVMPGQKIKLRRGLLYIAEHLKLPIQPVGTDVGLYWPRHGWMKPGVANIYFEPMLPPTASLEEISEAINRHSA
jgi:1-acyl-sn-glycerol-3-phosphate acyltransferase